jgi:hypothetical protein
MKVKATITFTFDLILDPNKEPDSGTFKALKEFYTQNPGDLFECAGWSDRDPDWPSVTLEPLPEGYQAFAKDDDGHDHATNV